MKHEPTEHKMQRKLRRTKRTQEEQNKDPQGFNPVDTKSKKKKRVCLSQIHKLDLLASYYRKKERKGANLTKSVAECLMEKYNRGCVGMRLVKVV